MKTAIADNYRLYFMSAAKELREAANALDQGRLGDAETHMGNAATTVRWVQDNASGKTKKRRK